MIFVLGFLALGIASLVLGIYTIVDATRYPEWAFQRAGSTRTLWIVLPIVFIFVCGFGALVMGIVWLGSKRAQLDAAMISAGYPSPHSPQAPWGPDRMPPAPPAPPSPPAPPAEPPPPPAQ